MAECVRERVAEKVTHVLVILRDRFVSILKSVSGIETTLTWFGFRLLSIFAQAIFTLPQLL